MSAGRRLRFGSMLLVIATGAAFATVAVAGALPLRRDLGDPVSFLESVVRQIAANDYARAWQTLAPVQQRAVSEENYVRCESVDPIPGRLASIEVMDVADSQVRVAGGGPKPVDAEAVTLRLSIVDRGLGASAVVTHTVHAVEANGRWAWILPARRLRLDGSSTCGAPRIPGRPTFRRPS